MHFFFKGDFLQVFIPLSQIGNEEYTFSQQTKLCLKQATVFSVTKPFRCKFYWDL